jgi:hypothetical protein
MDCIVFTWETEGPLPATASDASYPDSRSLLRGHLRLIYPVAVDDEFADLVRALNRHEDIQ